MDSLHNSFSRRDWSSVVIDIPFLLDPVESSFDLRRPSILDRQERRLLSTLAVSSGPNVDLPLDALEFARHRLDRASYSLRRAEMSTVGRLFDYRMHFQDYPIEDAGDFDVLVASYLYARLTVPELPSQRGIPTWQRIGIDTAQNDFRAIKRFCLFSQTYAGPETLLGQALRPNGGVFEAASSSTKRGLLEHLKVKAERWRQLVGEEAAFPSDLKWIVNRRLRRAARSAIRLMREEVDAIIEYEKNPMFRALWILLAWGGPRISEALNLWICDVLPGSNSRFFANFVDDRPFVLFCHPFNSTYCGQTQVHMGAETREEHLRRVYTRKPRVVPDEDVGQLAGWKGMLFFDRTKLLSWAIWLDNERAMEFAGLSEVINRLHRSTSSSDRTPYFFINSPSGGEYAGDPLRIKRVEDAFAAVCRRAGVHRGDLLPTVHVLRHFYTDECRDLELSDWEIQLCLHHGRISSQEDYGKSADLLHRKMSSAMARGRAA